MTRVMFRLWPGWTRAGRRISALAALLSVGGALFLALVPTSYSPCPARSVPTGAAAAHCGANSATLADVVSGQRSVYLLLALIPVLSLIPLALPKSWWPATILVALVGGFLAYGFATWPSTGSGWWAFLPATVALAAAAICAVGSWLAKAPS